MSGDTKTTEAMPQEDDSQKSPTDENSRAKVNLGTVDSKSLMMTLKSALGQLNTSVQNSNSAPATPAAIAAAAAAEVAIASGAMGEKFPTKRKAGRRWTQHEDTVLRALVEKNGNRHWKRIAKEFAEKSGSERSDVQCLHRWNKCLKPGLLKGPWTPEEDNTIRRMILEHGGHQNIRWSVIAKVLKGRLGKQVRERWINHLDPSINKGEWTPEEDESLYELQKRFGNRWKWIAELMPGRSENGVKNRWHSIKPQLQARKDVDSAHGTGSSVSLAASSKDSAAMSQATRTATAAAVAAAIASKSKGKRGASSGEASTKRAAAKRRRVARTKKDSNDNTGDKSPGGTPTLADLLSIGQSLAETADSSLNDAAAQSPTSPMDLSAVTERAKELLRMSESYREMARVMLNSHSSVQPTSPQFNDLLSREITKEVTKQLAPQLPTPVLTTLGSPLSGITGSSPISTDPVLFSNYYKAFTTSMQKSLKATQANAGESGTPLSDSGKLSPTQLLQAAALSRKPDAPAAV